MCGVDYLVGVCWFLKLNLFRVRRKLSRAHFVNYYGTYRALIDLSLELKRVPCLDKNYLLIYPLYLYLPYLLTYLLTHLFLTHSLIYLLTYLITPYRRHLLAYPIRGRLFNLARLTAKTKVREVLIRDMLFADDAAVATHTQQEFLSLMDRFSQACKDFGLTISLKKTNVLRQSTETPPSITIDDYELDAVHQFTYLGSTITDNLSLDAEIDKRIGKAATTHARLTTRVWTNTKLTVKTKMAVYNACVISTLLYGSEAWTTYARQERRLNTFQMRILRRILGISWQDKVPNTEVLSRAGLPSMYTLLRQRRLRWLGHVHRMPEGRIPTDLLFGELASGKRSTGRPQLRYRDVVKRDMKTVDIGTESWESLAANRSKWRGALTTHLKSGEEKLSQAATERRSDSSDRPETVHTCDLCNRECRSRIGLYSHRHRCSSQADN